MVRLAAFLAIVAVGECAFAAKTGEPSPSVPAGCVRALTKPAEDPLESLPHVDLSGNAIEAELTRRLLAVIPSEERPAGSLAVVRVPGTGFYVVDQKTNKLMYVLKIFLDWRSFLNTLTATALVENGRFAKFEVPRRVGVVRLKTDSGVGWGLLMTAVRGRSFDALLENWREQDAVLRKGVVRVAHAFAELHSRFDPVADEGRKDWFYDQMIGSLATGVIAELLRDPGWIDAASGERLKLKILQTARDFRDRDQRENGVAHYDAHGGNVFLDGEKIAFIDLENLEDSVLRRDGTAFGVGDPYRDVGRFYAALKIDGIRFKIPGGVVERLQKDFLAAYAAARRVSEKHVSNRMQFHVLRYGIVNVEDRLRKLTVEQRKAVLEWLAH